MSRKFFTFLDPFPLVTVSITQPISTIVMFFATPSPLSVVTSFMDSPLAACAFRVTSMFDHTSADCARNGDGGAVNPFCDGRSVVLRHHSRDRRAGEKLL